MSLSIGIVGLPNAGKSTLFAALTKKEVEIANYPFATIDPNVGIVEVADERLDKLTELSESENTIPATIEFLDIAGLVKGANKGEGLGNQFLANIREVDAVVYVVRAFGGADIHHVENTVDALRDIQTLRSELALKDLETIEKRIDKVKGEAQSGSKEAKEHLAVLESFRDALNDDKHIWELKKEEDLSEGAHDLLHDLQLLTAKPALYVLNIKSDNDVSSEIKDFMARHSFGYLAMNIREEFDSADLLEEQRSELGLGESGLSELSRAAYKLLNLLTFFTTGPKETRAWTVKNGATAPEAAGVIHTDFQQKFIRAEVVKWDDLLKAGGLKECREKGILRAEGKEYVVKDGDVCHFLHS